MGRMLETMKLGQTRRPPQEVATPLDERLGQPCMTDWEIAEEVPYVEVGGPGKKVEASPSLLKHAPQAAPQPPHRAAEKPAVPVEPQAVSLSAAPGRVVSFEPWRDAKSSMPISRDIIAHHQPDHAASKEYEAMLEAMRAALKPEAANVLLLVGAKAGVGASTVLLNLAALAASKHSLRVAVIEADAEHPGLAERLGHPGAPGLGEVLAGALALEHAVVPTAIPSLHLLSAGKPSKKPTSGAMTWLIAWLRERFDLILIDAPSIADASLLLPHGDAVYLVLPSGEPTTTSQAAAQAIASTGGRLCGLIHTHFGRQAP